jgi:Protein of unknown function (DUF2807).
MGKVKLIVFIAALAVGLLFANVFAFSLNINLPRVNFFSKTRGSGNLQTEKRDVAGFSRIKASGAVTVEVTSQKDFLVEVEADDNLLQYVKTDVRGETLRIYTKGRFKTKNPIRVRINIPQIESLDISGASKAVLTNVKNESLTLEASGASKIAVEGETSELKIDLSGASRIDTENLKASNVTVEASGASSAIIFADGEINAHASGASSIRYVGEPTNVVSNTSGASSVKRR